MTEDDRIEKEIEKALRTRQHYFLTHQVELSLGGYAAGERQPKRELANLYTEALSTLRLLGPDELSKKAWEECIRLRDHGKNNQKYPLSMIFFEKAEEWSYIRFVVHHVQKVGERYERI